MHLFKKIDPDEDEDIFPLDDEDLDEEELDEEDEEDEEDVEAEEETEDLEELEEIESKIGKGEDVAVTSLDISDIPKSKIVYVCPGCKKIYLNKKWMKDNITDLYAVRTELAYCNKCVGKAYDNYVGIVEVYDQKLDQRKDDIIQNVKRIERGLEETVPFEKIIKIVEKNGILFIFANTSRLALEIGKMLRNEYQGVIQYEWFERNQYLRVKWYGTIEDQDRFRKQIKELREFHFGMFSFE
ncbi:MAG: hypothetical protein Kow0042_03500 [Calditrichia bacterium]